MVSVVLLTTEEVLQRNQFWQRLDSSWITEEMEPFEDIKPEHLFIKPLSRDTYYAKHPDIPRSESEDENFITLNSFQKKHSEWKSKACVRRYDARRRKRYSSTSNLKNTVSSMKSTSRRVKSLVELNTMERRSVGQEDKVQAFLQRLLESVPPPPMQELEITTVPNSLSNKADETSFNINLPDYIDFAREKILENSVTPSTSTMKENCKSLQVMWHVNV